MASKTPGILYVTMHPHSTLPPSHFHDWYNNDHGPTRLRLPWVLNGFRYRATDNAYSATRHEFMAVYDIEDMHNLTTDEYTRLRKPPVQSQRERDTMKQITVDRRFYDCAGEWTSPTFSSMEIPENEGEKNIQIAVSVTLHPGPNNETEFKKWYEDEHIELIRQIPGWRRTRRFVTSYLDIEAGRQKEYLVLHDYAPENDLQGEQMKKAVSTEWAKKVYGEVVKDRTVRAYELFYTFGAAPRDLASLAEKEAVGVESTDGKTRSIPKAAEKEEAWPAIESYVTTSDGVELPYRIEGSQDANAPVLLCVNSILVDYGIWDDFVPAFLSLTKTKYRVVRFNTRGRSSLPTTSTTPITIQTLTTDIIILLDTLRIQCAALIGVSLGGATVLNAALTYPNRVSAFTSCDTNATAPPGNPKAWGERIAMAESESATSTSSDEGIVGSELAEATVRRWFTKESYESATISPRIERTKEMVMTNSLDGFKKSVNALYEYDFRDAMAAYEGKGVFVVGAGDGVLPKTMREMAGKLGKGTRLEVVEGAGHLPMVEKPEVVAGFVARFLEG
jgi:pimeloyl-ACP methyl ester carboxylesterase